MRRVISLLLISCLTVLSCSGCSLQKEKEVVQLSVWMGKSDQKLFQKRVQLFEKKYQSNVDFDITFCEESEDSCGDTVLFSPEHAADVFVFADDQLNNLVNANVLAPITEDTDDVIKESGGIDSVAIEAASMNHTLYAYPFTASNGYFLYYNSNYFSKDDVKSMDRILEVAQRYNKKVAMDLSSGWYTYSFFKAAGMDATLNEQGNATVCDWNRTSGQYTGIDVSEAILSIAKHPSFTCIDNDEMAKQFEDGTVIAGVSGAWNVNSAKKAFKDGYAACKLPTFTIKGEQLQMHSIAGYKLIGVNAHGKHVQWSMRLAQWLSNKQNQLFRFEKIGEGPANVSAAQEKEVQQSYAIAALNEQSKYAHLQRVTSEFWDPTYKYGMVLVAGNPDHKDLQRLLDVMVKQITKKNY